MGLGGGAGEPHIVFRLYPRESLMLFRRRMGILPGEATNPAQVPATTKQQRVA
jgi:hypothetical protein